MSISESELMQTAKRALRDGYDLLQYWYAIDIGMQVATASYERVKIRSHVAHN